MPDETQQNPTSTDAPAGTPLQAPRPHQRELVREFHGRTFVDHYEWMRDKDSPEVREHLESENAWTKHRTQHLQPLADRLFDEVKSRVQETDMSLPTRSGDWWYYSRTEEGKSYARMCRLPVASPKDWTPPEIDPQHPAEGEEVFLDCNELAEGEEFFSLGAASVTLDGTMLAFSVDNSGDERFTLRFKDLTTGEMLDDQIEDVFYGATWVGSMEVYYQRVDEAWRPHEVWRHRLGTPVEQDELIFREEDQKFWTGVGTTRSERFLLINSGTAVTSECYYLDLQDPDAELTSVLPREHGVEYGVVHAVIGGEDRWLVVHNANGVNSEIGYHPIGRINSLTEVTPLIAHRDDVRVEGVDAFSDHLVISLRENALETTYLMALDGSHADESLAAAGFGAPQLLDFDEDLVGVVALGDPEWDTPMVRVAVSSFTTPARVFDVEWNTGERHLRREQEVLPDPEGREFNPADYIATRDWVTAKDGVRIPISIIRRRDVDLSTPNPVLLYGYGSYESSMDPGFSYFRLSMLSRGVVYVIAHVRGGGEMGRSWYDDGKMLKKTNTFTDFIAVADHLIDAGTTTPQLMVAEGGSAGGLLMGAVANMAGDRFNGIQAVVPFVDPLTSILKPELPLTVGEWEEWGDPFHDPEVYDYMATYAPYENISADNTYPQILAVTSINDTRVLYVEPAKWVAKLREVAGADAMLKIDMSGGHGGVSGRYEKWRQSAFETAWELDRMGIDQ